MRKSLFTMAVLVAAGLAGSPLHAHDPAAHRPVPPAAASQAGGQRWVADAALRRNMRDVRAAVDALAHYEHGHLGPKQVVALAGNIESRVRATVAQSTLAPDAEAALRAIVAPLLAGAASLKADPSRLQAIPPMRQALAEYERRFDEGAQPAGQEQ